MLQKQNININFASGLDTKTDPFQVTPGKFLTLQNTIFTKGGLLQKRNGYGQLTSLPNTSNNYLTTFKQNLIALGTSLNSYSSGSMTWNNKGNIPPCALETLSLVRSNTNQSQADTAISSNNLICTVFTDNIPSGGSTVASYKYAVSNQLTGEYIVAPSVIAVSSGTISGSPRIFSLGSHFIIVITNNVSGTFHLQYLSIAFNNPTVISLETDLSTQYTPNASVAFDGAVANNSLYIAWNGSDGGGAIRMTYLDSTLQQHNTVVFAGRACTIMAVCADTTQNTAVIYAAFYNSSGTTGFILAVDPSLTTILSPTQWVAAETITNVTVAAKNQSATIFYELSNTYSYSAVVTDFIRYRTCTQAGTLGTATVLARSVGLASKAFISNSSIYVLALYSSTNQSTYFLLNASGSVICKLAYSNGDGLYVTGLPSASIDGTASNISYLFKDLLIPVNKDQTAVSSTGVYAQTGVNIATFDVGSTNVYSAEIGSNLNISGGFLWMYDGSLPVEQGFHLYPENVGLTGSGTGGLLTAQQYFYSVIYEWTDNQGNIFRSAPSIPVSVTTTGSTSSVTVNVPTLRLTYKTVSVPKIVIYRWSTAQQIYYQVTSVNVPVLNDTTVDSVAFVDTLADSSIVGNSILYTIGGVVENIAAPATTVMTLYKSRLFLVPSEDPNLLWYSKTVIEGVPVEMSDLFTQFIAPTTGAQGSTGDITALSAIDDKLIIFKKDAIYYMVGNGPDATGAFNDFSEPVFITATVGCANQKSIVFIPQGLMFQSDKGIWLLGRDLSTNYIGAPVEAYNSFTVQSAVNVPGTNQVRFTLSNGTTLMYDYYYNQWGTFINVPAVSATLYQNLHTFINSFGAVYQETEDLYLDGSIPVTMKFTTSWFNFAGLQGFERAYFFYLLGSYITPHKLSLSIAYDYNSSPSQIVTINPINFNGVYGSDTIYGGSSPYGGNSPLEQWRIFLDKQKCQAFQITMQESYDPSFGVVAGAGLTLSGLDLTIGIKDTRPRLSAAATAA